MAKAENDELAPLFRRSALLEGDRVRLVALQAERMLESEQNASVTSIARVMGEIDDVEARADLQTRMLQLEEQVQRLSVRRDEIDQAIESKIHILRTTIESALEAIGQKPPATVELAESLRDEFEAKLLEARSDLRFEILQVQKQVEESVAPPHLDAEALREELEDRLYASEQRNANAATYLEEMINAQRERIDKQEEFRKRMSSQLATFVSTLAPPE
ncbi:MAG TPA: hypothetical protein VEU28_11250 [Actinomycetota bacterium]|nr:hypothetical protein [Actinomycetota bacterium]